jgi:nitroreductase
MIFSVSNAVLMRKSIRAFLDKEVPLGLVHKILGHAMLSPSGDNHQPWQVAVLSGQSKDTLCSKLEEAFRSGKQPTMDYEYYPQDKKSEKETEWFGKYKDNRKECGLALYSQLGITREMQKEKDDLYAKNYRAFDAPVMLLFFIDRELGKGSYVDYGMFLQNIMLLATESGLATCPQGSLSEYADIVREELPNYKDKIVLCGMSMGYSDYSKNVNKYRTTRQPINEKVEYYK